MSNHGNSPAFSKLKPLCVNFLKDCNIENIIELENAVKEIDSNCIEKLQEFILVPFIIHLNSNHNEKVTIRCIDLLTLIFKKTQTNDWRFFSNTFSVLLLKISDMKNMNKTCCASEELKISVCECLLSLISCSTEEILNEMYSLSFRPNIAQAFYLFNVMLREERSKTLLKAILQAVGGLTYCESYLQRKKYKTTELIASEALASCLPGLSVGLMKIICGDDKQAHGVITSALDVLTSLIILTVGDESFERLIANDPSSKIYQFAYKSGKLSALCNSAMLDSIPLVLKNKAWFESVAQNLEIVIKNVTALSVHNHWKVRLQVLKCAELLLFFCNKTLNNCIPILLPIVFGLSVDNNTVVSSSAKNILVSLSERLQNVRYSMINDTIIENIESLIGDLMKYKVSGNDNKKLSILKSLLGYMEISSSSLNKLTFSLTIFKRLILSLITFLEFDISDLNLVVELPNAEGFDSALPLWPKKKFKYFENEEILNIVSRICHSLGQIENSRVVIEYLFDKIELDLHTLECIFVTGHVIKGFSKESDVSQKSSLINEILEKFLSPLFFAVPFSNSDFDIHEQTSKLTLTELNKNKLQVCLILEAIAYCSEFLKTDFRCLLMNVLCPVMEKAGSSNYVVSQCGLLCLQHMSNFCSYKSVRELIKDNADYITNFMIINFHEYVQRPQLSIVLRVAMEQSDAEAIILFRDLIFQILDCLDYNQMEAYPLMCILLSVATCIKNWFPSKKDSLVVDDSFQSIVSHKSLRDAVKDYINTKKAALTTEFENCDDEDIEQINSNPDEFDEETSQDNGVDEEKTEIPLHVNIICEIFKRCIYIQSSENRYVRMLTLEIVELCILVLRDYERQLLPLVHEFWSPFLKRFTEDTFVAKAFDVLLTIANECGDFIRRRTLENVMPKIVKFLQLEHSKSLSRNFRQYQYTVDHSLQLLLLSEVGKLCAKLDISSKDINSIATVCLSYLEKEQPKVLQEAAAKSLKDLASIDYDAVWFYWNVRYSKYDILIPDSPSESLLNITFPYCNNSLTSFDIQFGK